MKEFLVLYYELTNNLIAEKEKLIQAVNIESAMLVFKNENKNCERIIGIHELID